MVNLLHGISADNLVAVGIFRGLDEFAEGDDGHAPQHKRGHFEEDCFVQLSVRIGERPIDVEEVLLDLLISVAKNQPVTLTNEIKLFKGRAYVA